MLGDRGTEALNRIAERIKALEEERDKLLSLLATERDKFGKREAALMAEQVHWRIVTDAGFRERDRWRGVAGEMAEQMRRMPGPCGCGNGNMCDFHLALSAYESALKEGL